MFRHDTIYMVVGAAQLAVASVATPVLTRVLGPAGFGHVTIATAITQVFFSLASLGLPISIQRWFARENGPEHARGLVAAAMAASLVASIVTILTANLWSPAVGFGHAGGLAVFTVLWGLLGTSTASASAFLRAQDRLFGYAVVNLICSVGLQVLGITMALVLRARATDVLEGFVIAQAISFVISVGLVRPRPRGLSDRATLGDALRFGLPLVPQQLAFIALFNGDRLVIQQIRGASAVGRYQVAYNLGALGIFFLQFINLAWLARIFSIGERGLQSRVLEQSRKALNELLAPLVIGVSLGAPVVARFWMPSFYRPAQLTGVMTLIALTTIPAARSDASARVLMAAGHTRRIAEAYIACAVFNIGLNILLVPSYGITGAAVATLVAYTALALWNRYTARRLLIAPSGRRRAAVVLFVPLILSAATMLVPVLGVWFLARAIGSVACLGWLLLGLRSIRQQGSPTGPPGTQHSPRHGVEPGGQSVYDDPLAEAP